MKYTWKYDFPKEVRHQWLSPYLPAPDGEFNYMYISYMGQYPETHWLVPSSFLAQVWGFGVLE